MFLNGIVGKWRRLIILLMIYILSSAGFLILCRYPLPVSCPFRLITGIPCPGCGGLRAARALLEGDVCEALWLNPLSCLIILFLALLPFIMILDIVKDSNLVDRILYSQWPKAVWFIVAATVLANWIWNICKFHFPSMT